MSIFAYLAPILLMALSAIAFVVVGARPDDDTPSVLPAMLAGALLLTMQAALWVRVGIGMNADLIP